MYPCTSVQTDRQSNFNIISEMQLVSEMRFFEKFPFEEASVIKVEINLGISSTDLFQTGDHNDKCVSTMSILQFVNS